MRKIVLASALALTAATAAHAGGNAPVIVQPTAVVPAPAPAGSNKTGALIVLGVVAALIAASGS